MDIRYEFSKKKDVALRWIAWRLPHRLVMWCYIRVGANATTGEWRNEIVPNVTMMDALGRWGV
jgi:hypothetical protein